MKRFKPLLVIMLLPALLGSAYATYQVAAGTPDAMARSTIDKTPPRTTTTTLPSKTNNAWDLPAITLKGLDGKQHSLSEWKGKVIMLNFWASWCAPCQYEIRDFVRYQEEFSPNGLQIIGLGLDDRQKLKNASRTLSVNYPVLVADPANSDELLKTWGNPQRVVPYTVVIAKDGRIAYIHRGQMDDESFKAFVAPLL